MKFKHLYFAKPELAYIAGWFLLTRLYLGLAGVLARKFITSPNAFVYSRHIWLAIWGVWDSGWYLPLAKYGYSAIVSSKLETLSQANYAFFPLYPLLMHGMQKIVSDYFVAGLVISNLALLIACVYLYKLVRLDFDHPTALRAAKFALLWPVSFIFSGVFTESLYLMLVLMAFYYARKRSWILACTVGFFLALTRSVGVLVIVPLVYEYLGSLEFDVKKIDKQALYFLLIPLGLALFSYYNYMLTGDSLAFLKIQYAWGRHLGDSFRVIVGSLPLGGIGNIFSILYTLLTVSLVVVFHKLIRTSYLLFIGYSIVVPLLSGLESLPRYLLVIFPLFILAAQLSKKRFVNVSLSLGLALAQIVLMLFWTTGFNLIK